MNTSASTAASAPISLLPPLAQFERHCVITGIDHNARALRELLKSFFVAGSAVETVGPSSRFEEHPPATALPPASDYDKTLREAARKFIAIRGGLLTELNYAALAQASAAATMAHGEKSVPAFELHA